MLVHVGNLQRVSYLLHYDNDSQEGNPRKGWAEVLVLQDLATLMPATVEAETQAVAGAWGQSWDQLGRENDAITALDEALDRLRAELKRTLASLD